MTSCVFLPGISRNMKFYFTSPTIGNNYVEKGYIPLLYISSSVACPALQYIIPILYVFEIC